jgi:hypothetical protein
MTIAGKIIDKLGGAQKVSDITGLSISQIHRWRWPKNRGGTGGLVPAPHQQPLLDYARANNLPLGPDDFFEPVAVSGDGKAGSRHAPQSAQPAKPRHADQRPRNPRARAGAQ